MSSCRPPCVIGTKCFSFQVGCAPDITCCICGRLTSKPPPRQADPADHSADGWRCGPISHGRRNCTDRCIPAPEHDHWVGVLNIWISMARRDRDQASGGSSGLAGHSCSRLSRATSLSPARKASLLSGGVLEASPVLPGRGTSGLVMAYRLIRRAARAASTDRHRTIARSKAVFGSR